MRTDNLNPKYASIPAEMFEPVNRDRVLSDQKIQTKPIGFLRDAFRRFVKNKGSVVAAVVIIFLLLFAIIAPFCTPYKMDEAFGYYKQTRPKVSFMNNTGTGFWDGTYVKDQPFQDYINYNAIAMGTMYDGVNDPEFDWDAVVNNEYNPIKKVLKEYTKTISLNGTETVQNRYEYRIDSYYEIGFVQVDGLTMDQYEDILAWEEETGKKVIYPIIDTGTLEDPNPYYNPRNLNEVYQYNYWYKHDAKNNPIDNDGNILTFEQIKENGLVPNYRYGYQEDAEGTYVFDGKSKYVLESEVTREDLLANYVIKISPFKPDTKGNYAFVDGEYVLASTLSPEDQAAYPQRYKMNYVAVQGTDGDYVFVGDQYKLVADLTEEELKTAYARYSASYTPTKNFKDPNAFIIYNDKYITFREYQEATGKGIIEWNAIADKYVAEYVYDKDGEFVYHNQKYKKASSMTEDELASLVKYYYLKWDTLAPGTHIYTGGEYVSILGKSDDELIDLIPRYSHGLMTYKRTGVGGRNLSVRVLYYNYHQYLHDSEPMFLFGADSQGYDILIRLAQGARLSFILATCVAFINMLIGIIYGSIQGFYGGKIDLFMEYFVEILAGIPSMILVVLFKMHFVDTGKITQLGALILAFVATGWISNAAGVRMQFYRFKKQEYVLAAKTLGASDFRLITKHIFPNAIGTLITSWAFVFPNIINSETTYSYLGIINFNGTDMTSIGTMLANGQAAGIDRFPHIIFFPALILALLMISFNLFGNGLRDAFNPQLRGSED